MALADEDADGSLELSLPPLVPADADGVALAPAVGVAVAVGHGYADADGDGGDDRYRADEQALAVGAAAVAAAASAAVAAAAVALLLVRVVGQLLGGVLRGRLGRLLGRVAVAGLGGLLRRLPVLLGLLRGRAAVADRAHLVVHAGLLGVGGGGSCLPRIGALLAVQIREGVVVPGVGRAVVAGRHPLITFHCIWPVLQHLSVPGSPV